MVTVKSFVAAVAAYGRQVRDAPAWVGPMTLVRDFPAWLRHQKGSALAAGEPWVTFGARRELERILTPTSRVFEYGTGGSTLFFARRADQVVSVEHDPAWFALVREAMRPHPNLELLLAEPDPTPPEAARLDVRHYTSSDRRYDGLWFREYARSIEPFPDGYFDVVLVDGRARVDCFMHGARKVRPGGVIVLDDTDRAEYSDALPAVVGWRKQRFAGPKPYVPQMSETTIWRRPR